MNVATQPEAFEATFSVLPDRPAVPLSVAVEDGFDFLGHDYRVLFEACDPDAFRHPIWLDAFYRHLAPARGARPVIVTGRDAAGCLVFLLPLILRRISGLRLLETADLGVSDYASPVIDAGLAGVLAADATLRGAVAAALPRHDVLRIRPIRAERLDDWRLFLAGEAAALDFSAHAAHPVAPYADWRKTALSPSFLKYLDRRRNRFLKAGAASLDRLEASQAGAAMAEIRALRAGRFAGDPIQEAPVEAFYTDVAVRGTASGFARIYRLGLDGESVGTVFCLACAGRLHYLLIGCDYAAHGRHSPGLVMYDWMMRDWVEEGGEVFDFTIGDEAFKADFATRPTAMHTLVATPTWRGRAGLAAFEARGRMTAIKEGLSQRVRAMRERRTQE